MYTGHLPKLGHFHCADTREHINEISRIAKKKIIILYCIEKKIENYKKICEKVLTELKMCYIMLL